MNYKTHPREYIHSWYLFLISFFSLIFLLWSDFLLANAFLAIFVLSLYWKNGLKFKKLFTLSLYAFSFSFSFFVLYLIYPGQKYAGTEMVTLLSFNIYKLAIWDGVHSLIRLWLLSLVSMSSTYAITYTRMILYLIIHKGLKILFAYPLLIALNSILLFKDEFNRIRMSARFRELPFWSRIFTLFPLLVFAIRHSQRGALSLVTRGLSPSKSFYFSYELQNKDRYILGLFYILLLSMVYIAIKFR